MGNGDVVVSDEDFLRRDGALSRLIYCLKADSPVPEEVQRVRQILHGMAAHATAKEMIPFLELAQTEYRKHHNMDPETS